MKIIQNQTGFTLMELLVTTVVVGMTLSGIATLFITITSTQAQANRLQLATQVAENKIESLRNNHYNSLSNGSPAIDFTSELPAQLPKPRSATVDISEPKNGIKRLEVNITYHEASDRNKTVRLTTVISDLGIAQ